MLPLLAFQQTVLTHPSSIVNGFLAVAQTWQATMANAALWVLGVLMSIDIGWTYVSRAGTMDLPEFIRSLAGKIVKYGLFIGFLTLPWSLYIVSSFQILGMRAGGINPTVVTPTAVFTDGANVMSTLFSAAEVAGGILIPITSLPYILAGLLILVAYAWLALHFVMFMVETYLVIYSTIILFGFGALQITQQYAERAITLAIAAGLRIMLFYLMISVSHGFITNWWMTQAQKAPLSLSAMADTWILVGEIFIYTVIAARLPDKIAAWLQGALILGGGHITSALSPVFATAATATGMAVTGMVAGSAAAGRFAASSNGVIGMAARSLVASSNGSGGGRSPKQPSASSSNTTAKNSKTPTQPTPVG